MKFQLKFRWLGRISDLNCYVYPHSRHLIIRRKSGSLVTTLTRSWAAKVWSMLQEYAELGCVEPRGDIAVTSYKRSRTIKLSERGWKLLRVSRETASCIWPVIRCYAEKGQVGWMDQHTCMGKTSG